MPCVQGWARARLGTSAHVILAWVYKTCLGDFPAPWSSRVGTGCTQTTVLGVKWVAVAPFELKIGSNESYRRAASVGTPPGAKKAQIRAKIIFKLPIPLNLVV